MSDFTDLLRELLPIPFAIAFMLLSKYHTRQKPIKIIYLLFAFCALILTAQIPILTQGLQFLVWSLVLVYPIAAIIDINHTKKK